MELLQFLRFDAERVRAFANIELPADTESDSYLRGRIATIYPVMRGAHRSGKDRIGLHSAFTSTGSAPNATWR